MKLKKKEYTTKAEKQKDFAIGVGVFVGLNVLLFAITTYLIMLLTKAAGSGSSELIGAILIIASPLLTYILPLLINLAALIYFAVTRSWIATGMLGAFAGTFLLALIAGIIAMIVCFAAYGTQL